MEQEGQGWKKMDIMASKPAHKKAQSTARGVWEVMITLPFLETHLTGVNRLSSSCDLGLCLHLGVLVETEKWLGHSKHLLFPQKS